MREGTYIFYEGGEGGTSMFGVSMVRGVTSSFEGKEGTGAR